MNNLRFTTIALVALLIAGGVASACNVPVFRYALERWRPDRYDVVLFHRGPLAADAQAALKPVYKAEEQELLSLTLVDLDKPLEAENQQLWDRQPKAEAPWMVVMYPAQLRIDVPVWSGPFTAEVAQVLVDSPSRQELAKRLMAGQTAVWLLLESDDKQANDAAAELLQSQIKELEKSLELPELTASPDDEVRSSLPLTVKFSMLRIARDDPQEKLAVQMLLGSEPDLRERAEPMVFPVFGRGRVLFGLVGAGITAENVADSAGFLVGPCSCQLKELNPGFDFLNLADWDRIWGEDAAAATLVAREEEAAASLPGVNVLIPVGLPAAASAPVAAPAPPQTMTTPYTVEEQSGPWSLVNNRLLLLAGLAIAIVLAVVTAVATQRSFARTKDE